MWLPIVGMIALFVWPWRLARRARAELRAIERLRAEFQDAAPTGIETFAALRRCFASPANGDLDAIGGHRLKIGARTRARAASTYARP